MARGDVYKSDDVERKLCDRAETISSIYLGYDVRARLLLSFCPVCTVDRYRLWVARGLKGGR